MRLIGCNHAPTGISCIGPRQGIRLNGDGSPCRSQTPECPDRLRTAPAVIARSLQFLMVGSWQHAEIAVDEYRMSWSDAIRAETEFLETEPMHHRGEDARPLSTLGRAFGRERSFTWVLGLAAVRADDARRIISNLRAAFLPIPMESAAGRSGVPPRD